MSLPVLYADYENVTIKYRTVRSSGTHLWMRAEETPDSMSTPVLREQGGESLALGTETTPPNGIRQ